MRFTYESYGKLIKQIIRNGYTFCSYNDYSSKCVIMRHDVDYDLGKAQEMALYENNIEGGIRSTYFLMLTTGFYNLFSTEGNKAIQTILSCGHDIGLHFDEQRYPEYVGNEEEISKSIVSEIGVLSDLVGRRINKVSMHRPSTKIIEADLSIPGIVNTYSKEYMIEFKYVSDSRRNWREPIEEVICNEEYKRIQILIHPFWYHSDDVTLEDTLSAFINRSKEDRYALLNDNFRDLSSVVGRVDNL